MKIGIFDSGVGGLTVLNEALLRIDDTPEYLYYADTARAPYGTRDTAKITAFAEEITRFLIGQGAECIVIACNTATSAAAKTLRNKFDLPIIGMEPAVKPALAAVAGSDKRVLVMATQLTLREKKLSDLIERYDDAHKVDLLPMTKLVTFAEQGVFAGEAVERYLADALRDTECAAYGAVVPGCTHFIYYVPLLRTFFPEDTVFVDGNSGTVKRLMELCGLKPRVKSGAPQNTVTYFDSGKKTTMPG